MSRAGAGCGAKFMTAVCGYSRRAINRRECSTHYEGTTEPAYCIDPYPRQRLSWRNRSLEWCLVRMRFGRRLTFRFFWFRQLNGVKQQTLNEAVQIR